MINIIKCVKCKESKETNLFPVNEACVRGFDSWCKNCHREYNKECRNKNLAEHREYQNNKRRARVLWLQSLKNKPCMDCGNKYEPFCMDFDHVRGDKVLSVTKMTLNNTPKTKILEEIEKCDLVCILCHNIRTKKRLDEKSPIKKYNKSSVRNIKIINEAKNKPCKMCFQQREPFNMQLDHIDPDKKFKNICQLKNFKVEILIKEISKCQVLCALCHRRKSIIEQQMKKYTKTKISIIKKKRFVDIENRLKECGSCDKIKSFDLFAPHKKTKDGCNTMCRECFNQYRRDKRSGSLERKEIQEEKM